MKIVKQNLKRMSEIKNVVLIGYFDYLWYEKAFSEGLKSLGLNIMEIRFRDYYRFKFTKYLPIQKKISYFLPIFPESLYSKIKDFKPDIILMYKGYHTDKKFFEVFKDIWITGYEDDNIFNNTLPLIKDKIIKRKLYYYDSYHCDRESDIKYYQKYIKNVKVLLEYYLPWIHYKENNTNKTIDVSFIGHAENDKRVRYIEYLVQNNIKLKIFGNKNWKKYLNKEIYKIIAPNNSIFLDDYRDTINSTKINLCFFSTMNNDVTTTRVFEIPACGGFLLCERTKAMQELYEEGKEAEFFDNEDELKDKIQFYLKNDSAREKIAQNGYERCLKSGYDIYSRMKQWYNDINFFMKNK